MTDYFTHYILVRMFWMPVGVHLWGADIGREIGVPADAAAAVPVALTRSGDDERLVSLGPRARSLAVVHVVLLSSSGRHTLTFTTVHHADCYHDHTTRTAKDPQHHRVRNWK